jgi:hypothetical protein
VRDFTEEQRLRVNYQNKASRAAYFLAEFLGRKARLDWTVDESKCGKREASAVIGFPKN